MARDCAANPYPLLRIHHILQSRIAEQGRCAQDVDSDGPSCSELVRRERFGVYSLRFGVSGFGVSVQDLGLRVEDVDFRVQALKGRFGGVQGYLAYNKTPTPLRIT